jgi:hypothetical protein
MPDRKTLQRARRDKRQGKSSSTQAGEFVREEMEHIREGKHGARSAKQAIAIGLSKARRSGVDLPPPRRGRTSESTRRRAERDADTGRRGSERRPNPRRSQATTRALRREGRSAASKTALARQAKQQARRKSASERSRIARKAARTRATRGAAKSKSKRMRRTRIGP